MNPDARSFANEYFLGNEITAAFEAGLIDETALSDDTVAELNELIQKSDEALLNTLSEGGFPPLFADGCDTSSASDRANSMLERYRLTGEEQEQYRTSRRKSPRATSAANRIRTTRSIRARWLMRSS